MDMWLVSLRLTLLIPFCQKCLIPAINCSEHLAVHQKAFSPIFSQDHNPFLSDFRDSPWSLSHVLYTSRPTLAFYPISGFVWFDFVVSSHISPVLFISFCFMFVLKSPSRSHFCPHVLLFVRQDHILVERPWVLEP